MSDDVIILAAEVGPPGPTGDGTITTAAPLSGDGSSGTPATIAAGALTDVHVAAANKDGVVGTASMRTLGTGAQQACAGDDGRLVDARAPATAGTNGGVMYYATGAWTGGTAGTSGMTLLSGGSAAPTWGYPQTLGVTGARTGYRGVHNLGDITEDVDSDRTLSAVLSRHEVDTSAARTLTLPTAADGVLVHDYHSVGDATGSATTNPITVLPGGAETINGAALGVTIDTDDAVRAFERTSATNWRFNQ
jgi:hypothetical protein